MAETAISSGEKLYVEETAQQLVREEIHEAVIATRTHLTRLSLGKEWEPALERLRLCTASLRREVRPTELQAALKELTELPDLPLADGPPEVRNAFSRLASLALLGLTTCDLFKDEFYDIVEYRKPARQESKPYDDLAAARRELSLSTGSSWSATKKIRISLNLDL